MGWLRKRRHNKLKEQLLTAGKLDQYKDKFKRQIKQLDERVRLLDKDAQAAYASKAMDEAKIIIHEIQSVKEMKTNIQKLYATLEKASLKKESQSFYHDFVAQLEDFRNAFKDDRGSKRKEKRSVKRYKKEVSSVSSHLEWIDKRIEKLDKSMDKKQNLTDASLANIDVEAYFNDHE